MKHVKKIDTSVKCFIDVEIYWKWDSTVKINVKYKPHSIASWTPNEFYNCVQRS